MEITEFARHGYPERVSILVSGQAEKTADLGDARCRVGEVDRGHAKLLGDREVGRYVVDEDALARRDTELVRGDEVDRGIRLACPGVPGDYNRVEHGLQVVALIGVVLAIAQRVRQQPDQD